MNRLYGSWAVVWAVSTAELCSLTSAVAYMRLPFKMYPEVVNIPPVSSSSR